MMWTAGFDRVRRRARFRMRSSAGWLVATPHHARR